MQVAYSQVYFLQQNCLILQCQMSYIQKSNPEETAGTIQQKTGESDIKKKVLVLSIFYFLVTVSMSSFSVVIIYLHQKYRHQGYGESYLTANSFSSIITYFFCPLITRKFNNSRLLLLLCTIAYFINMAIPALISVVQQPSKDMSNMSPPSDFSFAMEIIANIIGGVGSGLFWVLQGVYLAKYCEDIAQNKKGEYFSLANVILNSRVAAGPLLTMLGLGLGNQAVYFALLSVIVLSSIPIAIYYIPQINVRQASPSSLTKIEETQAETLQSPKQQVQTSFLRYLLSFFAYFKKVVLLIPYSIICGLIVGFVSSSLSHLLPKAQHGESNDTKIGIALFFFGLGNIVGGHFSGLASDKLGVKVAGYIGSSLVILSCTVEAIFLSLEPTLGKTSVVGFLSGVSFSFIFGFVGIVCTIHYKGTAFSFSTNKQITSISYIIYQWIVAFLNNKCNMQLNMTYQGLALIPLALFSAYCNKIECNSYKRSKQNVQITSEVEMKNNQESKQKCRYNSNQEGQEQ